MLGSQAGLEGGGVHKRLWQKLLRRRGEAQGVFLHVFDLYIREKEACWRGYGSKVSHDFTISGGVFPA